MGDGGHGPELVPRLCHIVRWSDFNGYGFNLHAEKGKAGQFIGKVDEGSPAEAAGLKAGDRIVEVNGTNIGNENHQQVVGRIKAGGDETRLLVVDSETDQHYKEEKRVVRGDLPEVKFLTAARDEDIAQPQMEDSIPAAVVQDTNGAEPEPEPEPELQPEPEPQTVVMDDSSQYAPRLCNLVKWPDFDGYGFNLHAEKDKPGQYIGLVDPDSPAEVGGLKEGDRIIEVNGDNIEKHTHVTVIQKIKSGGEKTSMLVVDRATDDYFKGRGQTICSSMTSVVVISTPSRNPEATETVVVAVVAEQVESAPEPEEPQSFNGTEEVSGGVAALSMTQEMVVDTPHTQEEEEEEVVVGGGGVEYNAYEEVEVSAPTPTTTTLSYQEDLEKVEGEASQKESETGEPGEEPSAEKGGVEKEEVKAEPETEVVENSQTPQPEDAQEDAVVEVQEAAEEAAPEELPEVQKEEAETAESQPPETADAEQTKDEETEEKNSTGAESAEATQATASNGINGGAVEETQPEAAVVKASEPEPAVVHTSTITVTNPNSDLNLNLSAAEMKERLKSRKKQDPRQNKTSFETKYKMFEKM